MEKAERLTDGRMAEPPNYCISSHLVKHEELRPARVYTNYLRRGALQFQAPRMINGCANSAGRPTQTRTELIAVRNTLACRQRKCRRALARGGRGGGWGGCCSELQVGVCLQEFTPVSINHRLLTAENCP